MSGTTSPVKRKREDLEEETEDDSQPIVQRRATKPGVVSGEQCPFLDTISRQNLDFDFERCCCVSLSRVNIYACLVCGGYYQGRGPGTHVHTHSVEDGHQLFMKLDTGRVYCVPENYEVVDRSLKDIQHVLNPLYSQADIAALAGVTWARTLDGSDYMPGLVGLNNLKRNDYLNVVVQSLVRVPRLRDYFLWPDNYVHCKSVLVQRFGELMRKVWNPRAFKGQVSPHEFVQAVINASKKEFTPDREADPVAFWTWLLNTLHIDLTGGSRKRSSIITKCFQGQLELTTLTGTGVAAKSAEDVVQKVPFFMLALDLPPARLFQDAMEANIIPQIQLFELLQKYNGERVRDDVNLGRQRFRVTALPPYLTMSVKRFTKNRFFVEKNPTIVNFPVKHLDLRGSVSEVRTKAGAPAPCTYNLIASSSHVGDKRPDGRYQSYIHRAAENKWYEVQDLLITETVPEAVVITEAYFQVYELDQGVANGGRRRGASGGQGDASMAGAT